MPDMTPDQARIRRILSLGAGVQSTTVLLMSCRGVLPKLDAAIFADTQWEPAAVYRHLDWLELEARKHGIPVHRVTAGNLRQDAIDFRRTGGKAAGGRRFASIPFFVRNADGSQGRINRQCTKEYKIEPVERCIRREILGLKPRQRAPIGSVEHWFGISADETQRMRVSPNKWQTFRYPLIHDVDSPRQTGLFRSGFTRQDCLNWLRENGYPEPPRSACIACPFRSDAEWLRLQREDPAGWQDAVEFDHVMREASAEGKIRSLERTALRASADGSARCGAVIESRT